VGEEYFAQFWPCNLFGRGVVCGFDLHARLTGFAIVSFHVFLVRFSFLRCFRSAALAPVAAAAGG
jgi:hypothetical protein